ncbi:Zinc finger protein 804A [Neolecta irregularis DAH-3]|uniref:Zinc finger protein 804A n=1 Tax=Neolecta irregularis (strain DAH-3) TaxID=1198029 RepID=A0A1U7LHJ9_NEOID|nr:Zinc finger protein 804A [Neolecta irregularis DAH-3]|eukprot:OLL22136.1 Zinc finger protein 804A [Neolecta irregularis DAH-3]
MSVNPRTEAARQALAAFYCELCDKKYARAGQFEGHLSSYDHQHKKRFKEMREMQRDPSDAARRKERERIREEKELNRITGGKASINIRPITIKPITEPKPPTVKRGFKNAFGDDDDDDGLEATPVKITNEAVTSSSIGKHSVKQAKDEPYDPEYPTA